MRLPSASGSFRPAPPAWSRCAAAAPPTLRIPATFPPSGRATRELSGMGTPDLLGTYGTFSYFTSGPLALEGGPVAGGVIYPVDLEGGVVHASLEGPKNPFVREPEYVKAA